MTDNTTPPIVVNATPTNDQLAAGMRTLVLVVSVVTGLAGLISKHDWAGFVTYVQSSDFLTVAALAISAATFAWGQWKTRHRAKQLGAVAVDPRVPDAVITTKS